MLQVHRVIHNALNHAVKWELVHSNVADAVDPPRRADKEVRVLGRDEAAALLEALRDTYLYLPNFYSPHHGPAVGGGTGPDLRRRRLRAQDYHRQSSAKAEKAYHTGRDQYPGVRPTEDRKESAYYCHPRRTCRSAKAAPSGAEKEQASLWPRLPGQRPRVLLAGR